LSSPCIPSLVLCITCLVPALYPLLSCIPCLGSAPQYILCAYSVHSFQVCIMSTSILASLRCTCFVIARQIISTPCRHSGQTPHHPSWTLRPTDRNNVAGLPIAAGHCSKHSDAAGCQDDAGHWVLKSICVFPSLDHIWYTGSVYLMGVLRILTFVSENNCYITIKGACPG
jgi:hypothetical protein